MSDCRHPRIRILNSTVPIDAVKCFFNPPRVPARVSVTVKNDLVPELIMPRLIGVSRNGLKFKFVKAVCPCRAHFPICGKTFPISTSVAKCRGSWVVGRGRGSWVWVVGVGVGKCHG